MAKIKPNDGDYVVIDSQWSTRRYDVRRVTKVTAQMYFYDDAWGGRTRSTRARIDEILFSSPDEAAVKLLSERLKSSDSRREEEERSARARWSLRRESLIGNAYADTLDDVSSPLITEKNDG
jgi:hypothetical protein